MPRRHPQASGAARLISDRLARRGGSSVLLIEQACQLDVHEPSTDSEARPRRDLDAPFRQLQCGGVYAHPDARLLAPEVLYEFVHADSLRGWIWGSRLKFQAPVGRACPPRQLSAGLAERPDVRRGSEYSY